MASKPNEICLLRKRVRALRPLIHCITNPISIHQCANAILAIGARPMMAEHPREVVEITKTASAAVYNLGNITDVRMESILLSAKTAAREHIPFVLDAVGVSCSTLRRDYTAHLLQEAKPAVIKGNYSEILSLSTDYRAAGVDADQSLDEERLLYAAAQTALETGAVVLASGKTDLVTDGHRSALLRNGTPTLALVTGTGCMLGMLCGCFLSAGDPFLSAVAACAVLGIAGEEAERTSGEKTGSFAVSLMDFLSTLPDETVRAHLQWEGDYAEF